MTAHGYCGGLSGFFLQQHFLFKGEGELFEIYGIDSLTKEILSTQYFDYNDGETVAAD
ncbi:hypothetical protein IIB49_03175 [Patescibacteria group bacterium]|nr:hypothetical protein [Patescibacteria group bacterium]